MIRMDDDLRREVAKAMCYEVPCEVCVKAGVCLEPAVDYYIEQMEAGLAVLITHGFVIRKPMIDRDD